MKLSNERVVHENILRLYMVQNKLTESGGLWNTLLSQWNLILKVYILNFFIYYTLMGKVDCFNFDVVVPYNKSIS